MWWQELLWGVDRVTPGQAVQEFLLMAGDLHIEGWNDDSSAEVETITIEYNNGVVAFLVQSESGLVRHPQLVKNFKPAPKTPWCCVADPGVCGRSLAWRSRTLVAIPGVSRRFPATPQSRPIMPMSLPMPMRWR